MLCGCSYRKPCCYFEIRTPLLSGKRPSTRPAACFLPSASAGHHARYRNWCRAEQATALVGLQRVQQHAGLDARWQARRAGSSRRRLVKCPWRERVHMEMVVSSRFVGIDDDPRVATPGYWASSASGASAQTSRNRATGRSRCRGKVGILASTLYGHHWILSGLGAPFERGGGGGGGGGGKSSNCCSLENALCPVLHAVGFTRVRERCVS